jgi:uncharacterized protein YcbX
MGTMVGTVDQLYRYSVKSMQPGVSESLIIGYPGVLGDRRFVVVNTSTGLVVTAKQAGGMRLLDCTAWQEQVRDDFFAYFLVPDRPGVAFSCGDVKAEAALSELLQQPVQIIPVGDSQQPMPTNAGFSLRGGDSFCK